ncbi:MAG TPA: hypothetical protein VHM92_12015 [Allosphingosinicella sp.]|nr:hypothetical protein [Allosphingosinicella sp.]
MSVAFLNLLATLCALPAAAAETLLAPGRAVVWSADRYPGLARFRSGALRIEVRPGREDGLVGPRVVVSQAGRRPAKLAGDRAGLGFESRITTGRWNRAGDLYLMLESYTGGAHCCDHVQVAVPAPGGFEVVDLGAYDGDRLAERPSDIDGDGMLDFVVTDDSFLYAFTSYAESVAPPVFLNVVGGEVVDVSTRPGFRPRYEKLMARLRPSCSPRRTEEASNGACAAYVAAAARAGRFAAAWSDMVQAYDRRAEASEWLPTGCRVATEGECPEAETIRYADFPAALRAFLVRQGYITG